jgi:hypothetical protein
VLAFLSTKRLRPASGRYKAEADGQTETVPGVHILFRPKSCEPLPVPVVSVDENVLKDNIAQLCAKYHFLMLPVQVQEKVQETT